MPVPVHGLLESFLEIQEGDFVPVGIPVHETVASDGNLAQHEGTERNLRLYRAAGAYPDHCKGLVLGLYLAGLEIDVRQGVKLGGDYVYVVAADAVGEGCDSLSMVPSGAEGEFAVASLRVNLLEKRFEHLHPVRVAEQHHGVGKFFGFDMEMENGSVAVNNKF